MTTKTPSIGSLIDQLTKIRDKRRELAAKDDELKAEYATIEAGLIAALKEQGMEKATGKLGTASLSNVTVATILDWDAAWKLIPKYPHLVQRRISDPSFRELLELKGEKYLAKYGMSPFVKTNLNLRSI